MSRLGPFRDRSAALERSSSDGFVPAISSDKRKHTTEFSETAKLLLAGGVAGALSKSATAPLARLTILYQVACVQHPTVGVETVCDRFVVSHISATPA